MNPRRYAHMCLYSWDAGDDYPARLVVANLEEKS